MVMGHGFGGTADAGLFSYARYFSNLGIHVLAFDYRHFGASAGTPRQLLSIRRQLQDWHAAIHKARTLEGVNPERIVLWGMSLSGGHVVDVAARDQHVCAVIAQFPMLDGLAALANIRRYAGMSQILKLLQLGLYDLAGAIMGRAPQMLPIVGKPGELAALSTSDSESGYSAITPPEWVNQVCARIALSIPFYRPGFLLKNISAPVFIQIARNDTILPPASQERFIDNSNPLMRVQHYPVGHFGAFSGTAFNACADDQMAFLQEAWRQENNEIQQAQQHG